MNTVEQFNILLNKSSNNRFDKWKSYRFELSKYILDSIPEDTISLHVIGCGNSDDVDLSMISKNVQKLTISDIDLNALNNAIKKYDLNREDIQIMQIDYSGVNDSILWNNFVNEMIKNHTEDQISSFFNKLKSTISSSSFKTIKDQYDVIIISPIYTQLLLQQGLSYISILNNLNYSKQLLSVIQNHLIELVSEIIKRFNQNILKIAKKNATIIAISDIFEVKHDTEIYQNIKSLENIEQYHSEYINKYGMGLGDYGLYNLEQSFRKLSHKWFEWPFEEEKSLFVKTEILKN